MNLAKSKLCLVVQRRQLDMAIERRKGLVTEQMEFMEYESLPHLEVHIFIDFQSLCLSVNNYKSLRAS